MNIRLISLLTLENFTKRKVYTVLFLIVILVTILQIWSSNRLATYGEQISKLEHAKEQLITDNSLLEAQIESEASLSNISQKSQELGFTVSKNVKYLQNLGLALNK